MNMFTLCHFAQRVNISLYIHYFYEQSYFCVDKKLTFPLTTLVFRIKYTIVKGLQLCKCLTIVNFVFGDILRC